MEVQEDKSTKYLDSPVIVTWMWLSISPGTITSSEASIVVMEDGEDGREELISVITPSVTRRLRGPEKDPEGAEAEDLEFHCQMRALVMSTDIEHRQSSWKMG